MGNVIVWSDLSEAEKCALVAEKVMGWPVLRESPEGEPDASFPHLMIWEDGYFRLYRDNAPDVWNPLSSIADAWEVVEAMGQHIFNITRGWFDYSDPQRPAASDIPRWSVFLDMRPPDDPTLEAQFIQAATPHEAICLAALRAKGLTVEV